MKQSIVTRMPLLAALAGIILSLAGFAHAAAATPQQRPHKAKGTLNIMAATDVGAVTLEPGSYEVKQVNSATGPFLRFTRVTLNFDAAEGFPIYQWEVVAEIKYTLEPLASTPAQTRLLLAADSGRVIGLEIRGRNVKYLL